MCILWYTLMTYNDRNGSETTGHEVIPASEIHTYFIHYYGCGALKSLCLWTVITNYKFQEDMEIRIICGTKTHEVNLWYPSFLPMVPVILFQYFLDYCQYTQKSTSPHHNLITYTLTCVMIFYNH